MTGAGTALRTKLELAIPLVHGAAARLWQAPQPLERYRSYLAAMHAVVRASVPLMETAAQRCATVATDPVGLPLRAYLRRHIREERGHDAWVRADLEALAPGASAVVDRMPSPSVAAMVGAQYYWVLHHHPVCILGYIAVLEGYSPPPGLVAYIADRTGCPDAALRTLRTHAVLDVQHGSAVYRLLDSLDLSPARQAEVGLSALHTVRSAARMLAEIGHGPGDAASEAPASQTWALANRKGKAAR